MANEQNLKHFTSEQSREEAVRNGRKGGIQSGIERQKMRQLGKIAKIIGVLKVNKKQQKELNDFGVDDADDMIHDVVLIVEQYKKAEEGDTRAAEFIAKIRGELTQNVEVTGKEGKDLFSQAVIIHEDIPKCTK